MDAIRMVIADDNPEFVQVLEQAIDQQEGFEIVGLAANGLEAVELVEQRHPDVLIVDLVMPVLDGMGVLEYTMKLPYRKNFKIIVLSAMGNDNTTQRAIALGADYFMIKPFDLHTFLTRVREVCPGPDAEPGGSFWPQRVAAQRAAGGRDYPYASRNRHSGPYQRLSVS